MPARRPERGEDVFTRRRSLSHGDHGDRGGGGPGETCSRRRPSAATRSAVRSRTRAPSVIPTAFVFQDLTALQPRVARRANPSGPASLFSCLRRAYLSVSSVPSVARDLCASL